MSSIAIISAAFPPLLDGIGDHTALLAGELSRSLRVTVLTSAGFQPDVRAGVEVRQLFDSCGPRSVWALVDEIERLQPDWVLLQYNPFGYGRRGLNLHLPRAMAALRQRVPATRLAVMFHETYVPVINWKFALMTTWQRWQFLSLGRAADVLFFSIEPWMDRHRSWFPGKPLVHLPVGSNLPRVAISRDDARARLKIEPATIVLGTFGTAHISRMFPLVGDAARAVRKSGRDVRVLHVGPDADVVRSAVGDVPVIADGPADAEEASRRLAAVDVYLTPYVDGVSTRRGALMAGLQHGLPVVGTSAFHTDRVLREADGTAFLLPPAAEPDAFVRDVLALVGDQAKRDRLAAGGEALYRRHFVWSVIASRAIEALTPGHQPSVVAPPEIDGVARPSGSGAW